MEPKKIEAISKLAYPETKTQMHSFLGLAGYYHSFVVDFAGIAHPLFQTLQKDQPEKFQTTEEIRGAVDKLKQVLCSSPILQFPNFNQTFILETDASGTRIAAILIYAIL